MNVLNLIESTAKQHIAPLATKAKTQQERRKAISLKSPAKKKLVDTIRNGYRSALMTDALLIGFGQPDCTRTLHSGRASMIYVVYGFTDQVSDKQTLQTILSTVLLMQEAADKHHGNPPERMRIAIAAGMETAREALATFTELQIFKAAETFEDRHPALVAQGKAEELQARLAAKRPVLTAKKHLVTFSETLN